MLPLLVRVLCLCVCIARFEYACRVVDSVVLLLCFMGLIFVCMIFCFFIDVIVLYCSVCCLVVCDAGWFEACLCFGVFCCVLLLCLCFVLPLLVFVFC